MQNDAGQVSPENIRHNVTGLVLAGGRGKRMGGEDKGLMDCNGRPVIELILERFETVFDHVVISANRNMDVYRAFGKLVVTDDISRYAGPLAGIHAGLKKIQTSYAFIVPCDTPKLHIDTMARMADQLFAADADLAVASVDGQLEPVVLFLKTKLVDSIDTYLISGNRKSADWVIRQKHIVVDFTDNADWFANINTPEDLSLFRKTNCARHTA